MSHSLFCSASRRYALVALLICVSAPPATAAAPEMLEARGPTMGTAYMVKVFDPPEGFPDDWKVRVDRELRQVNDQMSTYLKSSEVSRFNDSDSLDWFPVSAATAHVVDEALTIHQQSRGALEVTIAPLVDAWSFGPGKRNLKPPEAAVIAELLASIGSEHLAVRRDPPALRKSLAGLSIDLSAIAKGHGVDRVVDLLRGLGAENTFVEIGGDLRVTGDKAGEFWKVGIQQPDVAGDVVAVAHPLKDKAMATSGDYRNFFEYDGTRYSHTIDPRSGFPVQHNLASVTVIADDCMTADAWATAINVLGSDAGLEVAEDLAIELLLMLREPGGEPRLVGTGSLAAFSTAATSDPIVAAEVAAPDRGDGTAAAGWLRVVALSMVTFAIVLIAMAVGVINGRRSISGSCGGLANRRSPDGEISCSLCSNPDNACRELKQRMGERDSADAS